jgi:hypothetical protein
VLGKRVESLREESAANGMVFYRFSMSAVAACQVQGCDEAEVSIILARRGKVSPKRPVV